MLQLRRDLSQRLKNKSAMLHCGVRDCQSWRINHDIAKKNDINIDCSGAFGERAVPAHGLFNGQKAIKQLRWIKLCFKGSHAVQEPGLFWFNLNGFSLIEAGNGTEPSQTIQPVNGLMQMRRPVTQV